MFPCFQKVIPANWGPYCFLPPPHIPNETHQLSRSTGPQAPCLTIHIFTFTFTNGSLQETHLGWVFFQVLDQGAKHESPFTVFFGRSFCSKHILPPPPPPNDGVSRSHFFSERLHNKIYWGRKKQQHHFQKCEPWRLLTKIHLWWVDLLRNDTSFSPLWSSHWGCRGHPPSWRLRIPKVLRRWEKHYSIIHFRRMIDVKICLQNLTKHWHRFRCQMAYIFKYILHQL